MAHGLDNYWKVLLVVGIVINVRTMNINRLLRSYGYVFPQDVSRKNLVLLHNLGCIPIYVAKPNERWFYEIDFCFTKFNESVKLKPLDQTDIKHVLSVVNGFLGIYPNRTDKHIVEYILNLHLRFHLKISHV